VSQRNNYAPSPAGGAGAGTGAAGGGRRAGFTLGIPDLPLEFRCIEREGHYDELHYGKETRPHSEC